MQTPEEEDAAEEEAVDDGVAADETSDASGLGKTAWTPTLPIKAVARRRDSEKRILTFLVVLSLGISFAFASS